MPAESEPAARAARALLPRPIYDYFAGAAGDESTYDHNLRAFRAIRFRPRVLVPVSRIDTTTHLHGIGPLRAPVLVAPMAMQQMAHPDGELAVARAVKTLGLAMLLSMLSNAPLEDVAACGPVRLMQVYLHRDRGVTAQLLRRARDAGYKAVVLTVDAPRYGRRERDRRNGFHMPPHLALGNMPVGEGATACMAGNTGETGKADSASGASGASGSSALDALNAAMLEADLSEDALRWVVEEAGLPVWVKGVVRGDDARKVVAAGARGIVVSNHGGRQLEGTVAGVAALPEVVEAVGGRVPVLVDGGVRSGEDVVKALALGADACLVGRPVLWGLAQGGEGGVEAVLEKIVGAIELAMALCGARNVKEISRDMVVVERECKL